MGIEVTSYGLAKEMKTNDFYVNNSKDYKPPTYVDKLPPQVALGGGPPVTIDELPSAEDYYDGTKGLKMTFSTCTNYTTQPEVCMKSGGCGWCGSFKFAAPGKDWNPLSHDNVKVTRNNVGGAQLTT